MKIENPPFELYDMQYDVKLAGRIIDSRIKRGMTQVQLAKKMKVVQPVIARLENGNNPPTHKMLKAVAKALNAQIIPPDFFLL